ncbi:SpoIIIAH-like family protein [Peribacillus saganii]|uniref:SpoIIIAH-like family protein n=1 Tax=Peribacillus saganii TaxID=2303992 RepID=A0A372LPS0_9BACI|nr:SpoIIIAH-like family protein [Peribacillus saganii]RFU69791.1 SpoIIIAH-like family protein [Peribacillus saganii]
MLLKKQTVWLLTMLSLVVVLSVYYLTSPEPNQTNMAATGQKEDKQKEATQENVVQTEEKGTEKAEGAASKTITTTADDEAFEAMRLEIEDERSRLREELTAVMANTDLSAEERNKAHESIKQLSDISVKEGMLESLIVSMDYNAALVKIDGEDVNVTVKSDKKLSNAAVVDIINLVSKELDDTLNVAVDFKVSEK